MNKIEIIKLLEERIKSCNKQLQQARHGFLDKLYNEGFRCRLDELILLHQMIENQSFMESCKKLNIKYEDVNFYAKE